ncbi:hypothetical protein JCM33374_g6592 [Metschnikowia sp. JCM 33374]|nr:hypothetical protein JCM33374_g6592 [Metschnikowia sp. JCM 33374]
MDRNLALENHLLTRCYSSQAEITTLLETRYITSEAGVPHLVLLPTSGPEGVKPAKGARTDLAKNVAIKPSQVRKLNTRRAMKSYIKTTLASQKKVVARVQAARNKSQPLDIDALVDKYNIPTFDSYLRLHGLWQQYIQDLLFGEQKTASLPMLLPRLSTADFNGCWLRVIDAKDGNLIGLQGIVMYDSQHSFMMVVPQVKSSNHVISPAQRVGGLRVVSKRGTMFSFDVDVNENETVAFTIIGSRFELRAVDRAAKKFKSHGVEDIY